jgi:hypothetical protein
MVTAGEARQGKITPIASNGLRARRKFLGEPPRKNERHRRNGVASRL